MFRIRAPNCKLCVLPNILSFKLNFPFFLRALYTGAVIPYKIKLISPNVSAVQLVQQSVCDLSGWVLPKMQFQTEFDPCLHCALERGLSDTYQCCADSPNETDILFAESLRPRIECLRSADHRHTNIRGQSVKLIFSFAFQSGVTLFHVSNSFIIALACVVWMWLWNVRRRISDKTVTVTIARQTNLTLAMFRSKQKWLVWCKQNKEAQIIPRRIAWIAWRGAE